MKRGFVLIALLLFLGCEGSAPRAPHLPLVDVTEKITLCEGERISISPQPVDTTRYSYEWLPSEAFSDPSSPFQIIEGEKSGEFFLKVTDRINGTSLIKKINVNVNPLPHGEAGDTKVICAGDSVKLGSPPGGNYIYRWSPETGLDDPSSPQPSASPLEDTTYTLTVTDPQTGCSFSDAVTVFVNPGVQAYFEASSPICERDVEGNPQFMAFKNLSSGPVSGYLWDFGDGGISDLQEPVHQFPGEGTYEVTLSVISEDGCGSSYKESVRVLPSPTIFSIIAPPTRCGPGEVTFGAVVGGGIPPYTYVWDFGGGITSTSPFPTITFSSPGTYPVKLTLYDSNGCGTASEITIEVLNQPVASFIAGNICHLDEAGELVPLEPLNTSVGEIVSTVWDFGDGTTSTLFNPSHIYANPGTYTITLTVEEASGCVDSVSRTIVVYPSPVIISLDATPDTLCEEGDVNFQIEYYGGTPPFTHYWDFGSGNFVKGASTSVFTYTSSGVYEVRARVIDSNGCVSERRMTYNVFSNPVASISTLPSSVCPYTPLFIVGSYTSPSPVTYQAIDTGDGNTFPLSSTDWIYTASGTKTVTYTVFTQEGCHASATSTVAVYPSPRAGFTSNAPLCYGNPVQFTNSSTGAEFYQWDFGDGGASTEEEPSYLYINPGTYNVNLTVYNSYGCEDVFSSPVTVYETPIADFDLFGNLCTDNTITMSNKSAGADSYLWSFGNGAISTAENPVTTYTSPGNYLISLTATASSTGCYDTHSELIEITNPPSVLLGEDKTVSKGGQTNIGGSVSGGVPPYIYFWEENPLRNYIDSFTAPYPLVSIPSDASIETITYTLSVTDSKGCYDPSISRDSMAVFITDALSVSAGADRMICEGEGVQIGFPAAGGIPPYTYSWTPATGLSNPSTSPTIATPSSTITYTLTVTDSASNTVTDSVTIYVNPNPTTVFINPSYQERCDPGSLSFSAVVTGGTSPYSFLWNYGDGWTEYAPSSVSHNYSSSGTYTVLLSVQDTNLCPPSPVTATSEVSVRLPPAARFSSNSPVCYHDGYGTRNPVNFTDLSFSSYAPIVSHLWDFGDPFTSEDTSTEPNSSYFYTNPGNYTASELVTDFYGCSDIYSENITVFANPVAHFTATTPQCLSLDVRFTDLSSGTGLSYLYDFGDSFTSTEPSPAHLYSATGTYPVSLTVVDLNMCMDTYYSTVSIITPADAGPDSWVYTGGCVTIGTPAQPGYSYQWTSVPSDPSLSGKETLAQPTVCPYTSTTYTLNVTSPWGCYGTDSTVVEVFLYITYVYPESGTTVDYTNRSILLSFSEPMSPPAVNTTSIKLLLITVDQQGNEQETEVSGTVQYDDRTRTAVFTPSSSLTAGGYYEIRAFSDPSTGVRSIYENTLREDFESPFSVSASAGADTSPPSLLSYFPTGTSVSVNTGVYAVFNEVVNPLTVNESTFYLRPSGSSVSITATIAYDIPSRTIYLKPVTELAPNTTYDVYISGIRDLAGNLASVSSPAWSFTTASLPDITPPEVISVFPPDGSLADPTTLIYAYFSEALDPTTVNTTTFKLYDQNGNEVPGSVTYDPLNFVAVFTPQNFLEGWTTYTAYIDGIRDTAGNPMTSPYLWTFTASAPAWDPGDDPSNYEFQAICPLGGGSAPGDELWVPDYTDYHSPPFSWAYNVPSGPSSRNNDCYLGSNTSIDLSQYSSAKLSFYTKYYFRSGDYGYVEVSTDDGSTWVTVGTISGIYTLWKRIEIDLSSYAGESIKIRFRLQTNQQIPSKYWKIDDIIVTGS